MNSCSIPEYVELLTTPDADGPKPERKDSRATTSLNTGGWREKNDLKMYFFWLFYFLYLQILPADA